MDFGLITIENFNKFEILITNVIILFCWDEWKNSVNPLIIVFS